VRTKPRLLQTQAFRIVLVYVVLFAFSVTALLFFTYWNTRRTLDDHTDQIIEAEITGLREEYQHFGLPGLVETVRDVQSMVALWGEDVKSEGTSRVTWEIEPIGDDSCRLTVVHDQLREGANDQLYGGWPMILSGLKTWLETGQILTTPGSLLYT